MMRMCRGAMVLVCCAGLAIGQEHGEGDSAWRAGRMQVDVAGVVGRSDVVLQRPNREAQEAMPLGNGRLGVAVWAADGLTAQLNRGDTLPYRYATGQVVIPGIGALTGATNYAGRLNLYGGEFDERGGGMSVRVYVQPESDTLIVDVSGADPSKAQVAVLKLWEPRGPKASVEGRTGKLAESWRDDQEPGASGREFGSLAAITAEGREVSAAVSDARTITVRVLPYKDGHFRVLVASPHYQRGSAEVAGAVVAKALADRDAGTHASWWNRFWQHADLMKVTSRDGWGEYMENLRDLYLYSAAAERGGDYPGSQAGIGDLFSSDGDAHQWDPAAFWHWNIRMQVAANLGAGLPELNAPYFRLYRENVGSMEAWTREHMNGAAGICIPETMRFNGQGIEFETWGGNQHNVTGWNCDAASKPYYNARTLSTGAEVSLWIWRQYLATGDRKFLRENFPVMREAAKFLLGYEEEEKDGLMHTSPSNAHEMQWDVRDPTTDLAARRTLYAATMAAATVLREEPELVGRMREELERIPELPRVDVNRPEELLAAADDAGGSDVIAPSYEPGAAIHNVENIGLEPVWPYEVIGGDSPLLALARRTYAARPNKGKIDWSYDAVQAARLGLGEEVRAMLVSITKANQKYVNGFAKWGGNGKEFYVEQAANVALGLQEALVQEVDGVIWIAPAVPAEWNFDGSVSVQDRTKVDVQVRDGKVMTVGVEVGAAHLVKVKNPWPGEAVDVREAKGGAVLVKAARAGVLTFAGRTGVTYRIETAQGEGQLRYAAVEGTPATAPKKMGGVQIGLGAVNAVAPSR